MRFNNFNKKFLTKLGLGLLSCLLSLGSGPSLLFAQGGGIGPAQVIQPSPPVGTGGPASNAAVLICPVTATGTPCSPPAPLFSDPGLSQSVTNPLSTDGNG